MPQARVAALERQRPRRFTGRSLFVKQFGHIDKILIFEYSVRGAMKTRFARTDANHAAIVLALRQAGCDVVSLAALGHGIPDVLTSDVGHRRWVLMEIKTPRGRLTSAEREFHARIRGPLVVVRSVADALAEVGVL